MAGETHEGDQEKAPEPGPADRPAFLRSISIRGPHKAPDPEPDDE
ncbi:hypothetical protein [Cellulomonas sp. P5_C5]